MSQIAGRKRAGRAWHEAVSGSVGVSQDMAVIRRCKPSELLAMRNNYVS